MLLSWIIWLYSNECNECKTTTFLFTYLDVSIRKVYTLIDFQKNVNPTRLTIFLSVSFFEFVPYRFIWDSSSIRDLRVRNYHFNVFTYLRCDFKRFWTYCENVQQTLLKVSRKKSNLVTCSIHDSLNILGEIHKRHFPT